MPEQEPKGAVPEWGRSVLTSAWIDTRMEADRTMVALSAAGIGLLVTLLTTSGIARGWIAWFYGVAILSFVIAIAAGIAIFKRNAKHLEEALQDPEAAHTSSIRSKLAVLDHVLVGGFALGVLFSIVVGFASAVSKEADASPIPPIEENINEQSESPVPRDTASAGAVQEEPGGSDEPDSAGPASRSG